MKVIFVVDCPPHIKKGQVKDVREGYARNYLIPRKIAVPATENRMREIEIQKQSDLQVNETAKKRFKKLEKKLSDSSVVIKAKANNKGRLFGGITSHAIAEHLSKLTGMSISDKDIIILEPIRAVGDYPIEIASREGTNKKLLITVEAQT